MESAGEANYRPRPGGAVVESSHRERGRSFEEITTFSIEVSVVVVKLTWVARRQWKEERVGARTRVFAQNGCPTRNGKLTRGPDLAVTQGRAGR